MWFILVYIVYRAIFIKEKTGKRKKKLNKQKKKGKKDIGWVFRALEDYSLV